MHCCTQNWTQLDPKWTSTVPTEPQLDPLNLYCFSFQIIPPSWTPNPSPLTLSTHLCPHVFLFFLFSISDHSLILGPQPFTSHLFLWKITSIKVRGKMKGKELRVQDKTMIWIEKKKHQKRGKRKVRGEELGGPRWRNDLKLKKHQKRWREKVRGEGMGVLDGEWFEIEKKSKKSEGNMWVVRGWRS